MAPGESKDEKDAPERAVPIKAFVLSAVGANLAIAAMLFIEFVVSGVLDRNGRSFEPGLWLGISLVATVAIWGSTALIYVGYLIHRWLGMLVKRSIPPAASSPTDRSVIWDEWLDPPDPRSF